MSPKWWPLLLMGLLLGPARLSGQAKKAMPSKVEVLDLTEIQSLVKPFPKAPHWSLHQPPWGGEDRPTPPRYVPIPFDGNPEAVLEELLGQAREADILRKLIADIERDAKRLDYESMRQKFDALGQKNPELRKILKDAGVDNMLAKGKNQKPPTKEETKKLQDAVTKVLDKVQAAPTPKPTSSVEVEPPVPPRPSLDERAREWLRDVLEDARYSSWFRELLQDSPGLEESLNDLIRSLDAGAGDESWLRDLTLPLDVWDKVSSLSLPDLPEMHLPVPELSSWGGGGSLPVPGVPAGGAPSSAVVLSLTALLAVLVLAWWWVRARSQTHLPRQGWKLGPWPVLPQNVTTREQFMQAFEYLALLLVGIEARVSNHRAIAERMNAKAPRRREVVDELAALYEQARYAPANDLSPAALNAARHHLCLLAGVQP
jgi:hypothetical protein